MNSIPLISHHLFVAAVANDGRAQDRARKRPVVSAAPARPGSMDMGRADRSLPHPAPQPLRHASRPARA